MGIMTTGMHHTDLFALEGAAIGLLHRKSVDVGPEDDCLSAAPAMNFRVDSSSINPLCLKAEGFQFLFYSTSGQKLFSRKFWIFVKISTTGSAGGLHTG